MGKQADPPEVQTPPEPPDEELAKPARFRCERYPSLIVYRGNKRIGRFEGGRFETTDPQVAEAVERVPEVTRR